MMHKGVFKPLALFMAAAFLGAGCHSGTKPVAWNVSVNKTTPASIEVDFIGVSPLEKSSWNDVKPDDYWKPNGSVREGAKKLTTDFQTGSTYVLERTNTIWNEWFNQGATELMVMANLPGSSYSNGTDDRRRRFLPLNKNAWNSEHKTLQIEIQDEIIKILTPQKPQK